MDELARLTAIEAIRGLKARYFRLLDTKDWDGLRRVFTPDMQVVSPDGSVWLQGGDAFTASLASSLEHAVSAHQGFTSEIELTGDDTARGVWAMQDIITWAEGRRHPQFGWTSILGRGHYHDTFRKLDGCWRLASLNLVRLSLEETR